MSIATSMPSSPASRTKRPKIVERAELGMHGLVAPVGRADGPGAADIGAGGERVVGALATRGRSDGSAAGRGRRSPVRPHRRRRAASRSVPCRPGRAGHRRTRKHLVPGVNRARGGSTTTPSTDRDASRAADRGGVRRRPRAPGRARWPRAHSGRRRRRRGQRRRGRAGARHRRRPRRARWRRVGSAAPRLHRNVLGRVDLWRRPQIELAHSSTHDSTVYCQRPSALSGRPACHRSFPKGASGCSLQVLVLVAIEQARGEDGVAVDEQIGFDIEDIADDALRPKNGRHRLGAHGGHDDARRPSTTDGRDERSIHRCAREHVVELKTGPPMTSPGHGWERAAHQAAIADALQALGISRLILAIHDASFPAGADDAGRGTPYSDAGRAFSVSRARSASPACSSGRKG